MAHPELRRMAHGRRSSAFGPGVTFAMTVLLAFAALGLAAIAMPKDLALASISFLFFALAALVGLTAWCLGLRYGGALSYWDVAGALTLFGIFAGTLVDPDQLVRIIESQRTH
jgi:hypothetical protein